MAVTILSGGLATALLSATSQDAQVAALVAAFAGANITVRPYSGATQLRAQIYGALTVYQTTPRSAKIGALLTDASVVGGTADRVVLRSAAGVDVLQLDSDVGAGSPLSGVFRFRGVIKPGSRPRLDAVDGLEGLTLYASVSLPLTDGAIRTLTWSAADTGTVNVGAAGSITNTGNVSQSWSITPPANCTVTPSSGTLAAGATQALTITCTVAATYALTLVSAGATITGNDQSLVIGSGVTVATAGTLSVNSPGVNGATSVVSVTLNGVAPAGGVTFTVSGTNGATIGGTLSWTAGEAGTAKSTTISLAGTGSSVVTMTNSAGLANTGNGATYTSADAYTPPAPGVTIAPLTLLTAGAGTYPFSVGHAFKPGDVPAEIIAGLQCDVKSRWPDGSLKIAILSGVVTAAGTSTDIAIGTGIPPLLPRLTVAQLKATGIAASIDAGALGSATWGANSSDWDSPFNVTATGSADPTDRAWVAGPYCLNVIYRKQIGSDAHLTAWLDVRYFSTGDVEVVPYIENGYLLQASPGPKSGTFTFTLGGTARFGPTALTVGHHTRSPLISGSALSYWLDTDKTVTPKHDAAYLAGTGLVSAYLSDMTRTTELPALPSLDAGVSVAYTPFEQITTSISNFPTVMGGGGEHKSIGIQPCWEALALTTSTALAHQQMVRESYRFGRYHIHFREEAAGVAQFRPFRMADHLTLSVDNSTIHAIQDARGGGAVSVPTPSGAVPHESERWAPSHQPASPLLAYITTGRWWFMEECQFITNANWLADQPGRQGASSIYEPFEIGGTAPELRKSAWCLRNLLIAACVTPDDDILKTQFDAAVDANIANMHAKYVAAPANPFGLIETGSRSFTSGTASGMVAGGAQTWQYDFWTAVWGRAVAWRVGPTRASRKKASDFFTWVANSIVGRLGTTAATEWLYRDLSVGFDQYAYPDPAIARLPWIWPGKNISVSHSFGSLGGTDADTTTGTYPDYAGGTGPWWSSWGEMYDHMIVGQSGQTKVDGDLRGSFLDNPDGQFWNAFPAMVAAASLGISGASTGIARVRGNALWTYLRSVVAGRYPTHSVEAVTLPLENFTDVIPAVGARTNANLNDAYAVDFERASGWHPGKLLERSWLGFGAIDQSTVFSDIVGAYSGSTWAPEYGAAGAMILNGGADGASLAQMAYVIDLDAMSWRSAGAPRNLQSTGAWSGYAWSGLSWTQTSPGTELRDTVFFDYNWNGSMVTLANHSCTHNGYIPPAFGGGKYGSLFLPCSSYSHDRGGADPRTGTVDTWTPHMMNLLTGVSRRAVSAPVNGVSTGDGFASIGQTNACRDTTRNRLWYFRTGNPVAYYHDLAGGPPFASVAHTIQKVSGGNADYTVAYCATWAFVPEADAMVAIYPTNANSITGVTPPSYLVGVQVYTVNGSGLLVDQERGNFQTRLPIATQSFPKGGVFAGLAWVPASVVGGVGKFYIYEGYGDEFCYTLTPSSLDFASCSWTWGKESFTGPTPVYKTAYGSGDWPRLSVQGKFQYVPALGCLAWHDGPDTQAVCVDGVTRRGIVQLWRPPGTPI